ncbi:MAG: hypothetical protein AABW75_02835 [Nanoarchaeota archaeon]
MSFKDKKARCLIGGLAGIVLLGLAFYQPREQEERRVKTITLGNGVLFRKEIVKKSNGYTGIEITQTKGTNTIDTICYRDFNGDGKVDTILRFEHSYGLKYPSFLLIRKLNYSKWGEWFNSGDFLLRKEMKEAGF